jgi:hypothetical protein
VTIAACYLSPEGVVLGADSTTTYGDRHYNNSQKLFELGEDATIGVITWGLGGLNVRSHRTLFAELNDDLVLNPPSDMQAVATRWATLYWQAYSDPNSGVATFVARCQALATQPAYDPNNPTPAANARSQDEEAEFNMLRIGLVAGFCLAGYVLPHREPLAFEIIVDPLANSVPTPTQYGYGYWFWDAPKMFQRLMHGCDEDLKADILGSGHWTGSLQDLNALVTKNALNHPATVPIRDAIDFVHASILIQTRERPL